MRVAMVVVSSLLAACAMDDHEPARFVIEGAGVAVEPTRLVLAGTEHPTLEGIEAGDLVAGVQGGGYLRRVREVSEERAQLVLETEDVELGDAVGDVTSERSLSGEGGKADGQSMTLGVALRDVQLYADADVRIDLASARLDFTPDVEMDVVVAGGTLDQFLLRAAGRLDAAVDVHVAATRGIQKRVERKVWTKQHTLVAIIGWVPVVEVIELSVGVGVDVNSTAAFDVSLAGTVGSSVAAGIEYEDGGWSHLGQVQVTPRIDPVRGTSTGTVGVSTYLYAELRTHLYGIAGPMVRVTPAFRATRASNGTWQRAVGITADAGAEIRLPGVAADRFRYLARVIDRSYPL